MLSQRFYHNYQVDVQKSIKRTTTSHKKWAIYLKLKSFSDVN